MPHPSPVEQVAAIRAVRATTALLGEVARDIVLDRHASVVLIIVQADRVLESVLAGLTERAGTAAVDAFEED